MPLEHIDDNPAPRDDSLLAGLDYDPYVTCVICKVRWKPLPQNRNKAHVCSNRCRMRAKKDRNLFGPQWDLTPMPHKPWEHVKKRTPDAPSPSDQH